MTNQDYHGIPLATLIICLCLGSLFMLSFVQVSPFASGTSGIEMENYNLFDNADFDDDFLLLSIVGAALAELSFSKSRTTNLAFQSTSFLPVSPPPKPS